MKCTLTCVSWNSPKETFHSVSSPWGVAYIRFRTGQKSGTGWQKRKENHFHFLIELLLEHVAVKFCKVSCFQPAVLSEKWNPSQVFSKEFAKILKPGSKKLSINLSRNASICVLPLLSNYYRCLWNVFFSLKQPGRLCNKPTC